MFVLFWFVVVASVGAVVKNFTYQLGDISTVVIFDASVTTDVTFIKTYATLDKVYVIQVNADTIVPDAVCFRGVSVPVVTGSKGCDELEYSNCAGTDLEAISNAVTLRITFLYEFGSSECLANGGDIMSCFGPLYIIKENSEIRTTTLTPQLLLDSQGIAIFTMSYQGQIPAVTWVPYDGPRLFVSTTTCQDDRGASFNGTYEPYYRDSITSIIVNETRIFMKDTVASYQRVTIRRSWPASESLYIVLTYFGGFELVSTVTVTKEWLTTLPLTFTFTGGCTARFSIVDRPLTIIEPEVYSDLSYFQNKWPPAHYFTEWCGFHVGRYDTSNTLLYRFTVEGERGGGRPRFKTGDSIIGQPFHVQPDAAFVDYELDCTTFWPKGTSFFGYGLGPDELGEGTGAPIEPYDATNGICYSPFLDALGIADKGEEAGTENARQLDCFKLGGYTYLSTMQACARPIQFQRCKRGWFYFNQYCYYKFDPLTESRYKVSDGEAEDACKALYDRSSVLLKMTRDIKIMIQTRFVFYKKADTGHPYRVNLVGRRCLSFDVQNDLPLVKDISCDQPAFPLCRYNIRSYRVPYSEFLIDVDTIRTLRDGQEGIPFDGKQLQCDCFDGYGGRQCSIGTCALKPLQMNTSLSLFFQKCVLAKGMCENGEPRKCACPPGFAPAVDYRDTNDLKKYPCACPSATMYEPFLSLTHTIQGVTYPIEETTIAICGGSNNGVCTVEPSLNYGVCNCALRPVLDPESPLLEEPAYDGSMCLGVVAHIPPKQFSTNGDIVKRFCNGRGFSCPSGESYKEQRLNEVGRGMFGRDICRDPRGELISGCVCEEGWSGLACTCPIPKNVLQRLVYPFQDSFLKVYSLLTKRLRVRYVTVEYCETPITVTVQDGSLSELACTLYGKVWDCHQHYGTRVIMTSTYSALQCKIKAYDEWFPPCGNNTNPFAGRMFANEALRDFTFHKEPQPVDFASKGCTNTACMCGPSHGGDFCRAGISSFRFDFKGGDLKRHYCGETTLPPRGEIGPDGYCRCFLRQGVTDSRHAGEACELEEVRVKEEWLMCNGRGTPVPASFPYATCSFDETDYQNDPLSRPFLGINPTVLEANQVFTVLNTSVILINNRYWAFFAGQRIQFNGLLPWGNETVVTMCDAQVSLPLNMTFICEGSLNSPPVLVTGTVDTLKVVFICDDLVVDLGTDECYVIVDSTVNLPSVLPYCTTIPTETIGYECIVEGTMNWTIVSSNEESLTTGYYTNVVLQCAELLGEAVTEKGLAYGVFDCSDPVDRILADQAFQKGLVATPQCDTSVIVHHSNVLGEGYGLFHRSIPDLGPFDEDWTDEHYRLMSSILGGICELDGEIAQRAFDGNTWDEITATWLDSVAVETVTGFSNNATVIPYREYFVNITSPDRLYGNPYMHHSYVASGSRGDNFTFYGNRPGRMMTLPTEDLYVRAFSLRVSFDGLQGVQVYDPLGALCATFYREFQIGDVISVNCLENVEEDWVTMSRITPVSKVTDYWYHRPRYEITVVWSGGVGTFTYGDLALTGRTTSYKGLFSDLKYSIYVNHLYPESTVYQDNCLNRYPGRTFRAVNLTTDRWYLKDVYYAHFAVRKPTHSWQCQLLSRDRTRYQALYDQDFSKGWRGGDGTISFVGDEGGCECDGFSPHPCVFCTPGYGPETQREVEDYQRFFNVTTVPEYCTLPWAVTSTRDTKACGGFGTIVSDTYYELKTLPIFRGNLTRRCEVLVHEDVPFTLVLDDEYAIGVILYEDDYGNTIFIVDGEIYVNGELMVVTDRTVNVITFSDDTLLECRPWIYSATHHASGLRLDDSHFDFFLAKVNHELP